MTTQELDSELDRIGRWLNRRRALVQLLFWAAAAGVLLAALVLSDVLLRHERAGRLLAGGLWAAVVAAGLIHLVFTLRRRHTPASVAARLERSFPALDNHLINRVLFGAHPSHPPLEKAYLERPFPSWNVLELSELRNRRAERYGALAAGAALLVLVAPLLWTGAAWGNALLRILNPLSNRAPISLTQFLACDPGDVIVQKGDALRLSCRVAGRGGQNLYLDLWPADDKPATVRLGRLTGIGPEEFGHSLTKVVTDFRYRFRAGDGRTETYRVTARPPLALAHVTLDVTPPPYTGLLNRQFDALAEPAEVPQGSAVHVALECTEPLVAATLALDGDAPAALSPSDHGRAWEGSVTVYTGGTFRLAGVAADRRKLESDVRFTVRRDDAPQIRVLAPVGRAVLSDGAAPRISFEATDDYGLSQVQLERVTPGAPDVVTNPPLTAWAAGAGRLFGTNRVATAEDFTPGVTNLYRLVAIDDAAGASNVTRSAVIVFAALRSAELLQAQTAAETNAAATLAQLIDRQRTNLEATRRLVVRGAASAKEQWQAVEQQQVQVRQIAGQLLADPGKPLASLTDTVRTLYGGAMNQAIDVLDRVSGAADEALRTTLSDQAVTLEAHILSQLSFTESGLARAQEQQRITGLLAVLDALVRNQEDVLNRTRSVPPANPKVPPALVDRQDRLSSDVNEFVQECRREAENLQRSDKTFSESITRAADACESRRVSPEMLTAAEQLDLNKPDAALPPQQRALTALKDIQADLNQWRLANAEKKLETLQDAVEAARDKLKDLVQVQSKVVDAIRATESQKDKSDKDTDQLDEEVDEIKANMEAAVAKLANDLHIMPELPVGNDLVEDVSQVYEEMKQVKGSEATPASELGLQKEDFILDMLKMAAGRMDDMEMWLTAKPDATKRDVENFDKQELPKVTTMPMPTEMEDIIGDLLKQQDDIKDKADDSASNQGSADMPAGWDIAEGEYVNYSAKGKSGNERPDHREVDGRSNVGREGMSDGETVAGSGKVNEGDEKIEKRRTQDSAQSGQVQEDGHAKAKATGGGKLAGYGDEKGMSGGTGPRRDSPITQGSLLGLQALLRRDTEAIYAKATLMHIRTGSLDAAVHNMQMAEDALDNGMPIRQVSEFQRRAVVALKKTQAELGSGLYTDVGTAPDSSLTVDDQVATSSDDAPAQFRDLVSEYYKSLSETR